MWFGALCVTLLVALAVANVLENYVSAWFDIAWAGAAILGVIGLAELRRLDSRTGPSRSAGRHAARRGRLRATLRAAGLIVFACCVSFILIWVIIGLSAWLGVIGLAAITFVLLIAVTAALDRWRTRSQ